MMSLFSIVVFIHVLSSMALFVAFPMEAAVFLCASAHPAAPVRSTRECSPLSVCAGSLSPRFSAYRLAEDMSRPCGDSG